MLVPLVYMIGKSSVVAMNYDAGPSSIYDREE